MTDVPPLTRTQQRLGLGLAAFATVFFASTGVALFIVIGLAMTTGLALSAWRRNRVAAAVFAFITTFGPWVFAYVFGAAYAVYSLWLLSGATKSAERRNESSSPRRRTRDRSVGS
jgi:membrane protein implicated in regulation of membrane protease activity